VFAGGMGPETIHFLEACIQNKPVMVTPESARVVMEAYTAATCPPTATRRSICR
jgi:myo-inositol 2-dehydrogenase/D-chiro-inositol 1-dehydrogenase